VAGPWPRRANVPVTRTDGVWFVHVLRERGEVTVTDVPNPDAVTLVRTGDPIDYEYDNADKQLRFAVGDEQRASGDEVVAVAWPRAKHHLL
jgi:hypothetical protein